MNEHEKREVAKSNNPYFAKAENHTKAAGSGVTVEKHENPIEWQEWSDYFIHHRLKNSALMMEQGASRWTVPTLSPRDFDPVGASDAVDAGRQRRQTERLNKRELSHEDRRQIIARARRMFKPLGKMKEGELRETDEEFQERMRKEIAVAANASPMVKRHLAEMEEYKASVDGIPPPESED